MGEGEGGGSIPLPTIIIGGRTLTTITLLLFLCAAITVFFLVFWLTFLNVFSSISALSQFAAVIIVVKKG